MKNDNQPEHWEKVVSRFSKDALKSFEIFGCTASDGHFPCLPVDKNRIIFVACKDSYNNKLRIYPYARNNNPSTYGERYQGNNKVLMRCPSDCAVRGSAYDNGKRYNKIKEQTKHIKFIHPYVEFIQISIIWRILNWFKEILS